LKAKLYYVFLLLASLLTNCKNDFKTFDEIQFDNIVIKSRVAGNKDRLKKDGLEGFLRFSVKENDRKFVENLKELDLKLKEELKIEMNICSVKWDVLNFNKVMNGNLGGFIEYNYHILPSQLKTLSCDEIKSIKIKLAFGDKNFHFTHIINK